MAIKEKIQELYNSYLNNKMSKEELEEFMQLTNDPESEVTLSSLMDGTWEEMFGPKETKVVPMFKWYKVAAAVTILILLSVGGYFYFNKNSEKQIATITHDVKAPVSNKAMITLGNGKQIILDSVSNGTLAQQGNVNVIKLADGEITYKGTSNEIQYNTLSNPRGSKVINLTLADGSKLWLNAESSLKYPTAFSGNERKVEITGEAYFEVKHNAKQPFTVLANRTEVHDIGTAYNVNAYTDEEKLKVTLVEGSIEVSNKILKPGEQAQISNENIKVASVDVDEVVAWKKGLFSFESADLKTILRQLARWYDVEIVFEGNVENKKYFYIENKNRSLDEVLQTLKAGGIKFRIEGKKLFVER